MRPVLELTRRTATNYESGGLNYIDEDEEPEGRGGPATTRLVSSSSPRPGSALQVVLSLHPGPPAHRLKLFNTSLTSLDLTSTGLGEQAWQRIKHAMRDNQVLASLRIAANRHDPAARPARASFEVEQQESPQGGEGGVSEEFLELLRYAAIYRPALTRLDLSRCALPASLGEHVARLLGQEHCRVQHLDLSFNCLDASSLQAITAELKGRLTQPYLSGLPLLSLDLSCNAAVGTHGAVLLAEVFLGRNLRPGQSAEYITDVGRARIRDLQLSGCGIGPNGVGRGPATVEVARAPSTVPDEPLCGWVTDRMVRS